MKKVCTKCKIQKDALEYYKDPRVPSGIQPCCKECFKKRAYKYKKSSMGIKTARIYLSRPEIKEKIKAKQKRLSKGQKAKDWRREYTQSEKFKSWERSYMKMYRKTQKWKDKSRATGAKYRALKVSTDDGSVSIKTLQEVFKKQKGLCSMCKVKLDRSIKRQCQIDHIIPISKGGSHTITNIQYLCAKCNRLKSNK